MTKPSKPALLPPIAYWQPEWLEQEKKTIFMDSWVFAGLASEVSKNNDYLSFSVGGMPVIIRNMKGKLVAFRNICSHRYSQIHPEGCGNAMFRCPYHGWTYNADGVPIGIPDNAGSFGFDKKDQCDLALDAVALERAGNFLFVCVSEPRQSLKKFLGAFYDGLKEISKTFGQTYGALDQTWECNWKIALEITLEGYHLPVVHGATFEDHIGVAVPTYNEGDENLSAETIAASAVTATPSQEDEIRTDYVGPHSFNTAPLTANSKAHLGTVAKRLRLPQTEQTSSYDHYLISPNLMIGLNGGTNLCVERYEPLSPEKTRMQCWLMVGTPTDDKMLGGIIWQTITKQWADWTEKVIAEDQKACEAVQRGVRYANHRASIGHREVRILHYQEAINTALMEKKKAA